MSREEKRLAPRIPISLTAHCRIGNRFAREPVANLSRSGLLLRTREHVKEGTPIRVALALPYEDGPRFCTLVGSVARVERDARGIVCGIGVHFIDEQIGERDRDWLEAFLITRRDVAAVPSVQKSI